MDIPKLIVNRDIAQFDIWAEMWGEPQTVFSASTVTDFLDENKDATEIEVEIMSDGGSTSEARVIYDLLKNCGKKVITKGYKVNSSAVMIFLAGEERLIAENADFLIHPVWIDAMGLPWMLTGEDLQAFADEIKAEEDKLLDLYCSVIGDEKRDEVQQLMSDSTNLSNDKCVELGFATGKLEAEGSHTENKRAVSFNNKMAALVLQNKKTQNKNEMSLLNKTLETLNETLKSFTKNQTDGDDNADTQNASTELSEGGSLYYDGELAEGVSVFTDETMETPAPDGDHELADGRVVTVADGAVSALAAASSDEDEDTENSDDNDTQNTEVEDLRNEVSELKTTVDSLVDSQNKIAESLGNLAPALDTLKNLVPGDTGGDAIQNKKKENTVKAYSDMTNVEKKRHNQGK